MAFIQTVRSDADVALSNPNAFFALGVRYATGRDVGHDLIAAHKWFNIAASLGHAEARIQRRDVADDMTPGEVAEAQRQARTWLAARQSRPAPAPQKAPASTAVSTLMAALKAQKVKSKAVFDWAHG